MFLPQPQKSKLIDKANKPLECQDMGISDAAWDGYFKIDGGNGFR
jgi:hypothetical protein